MPKRLFWVLLCTFAAVAGFAVVRAASLIGKPFPGFLIYPNGMVSAFGSDDWPGVKAGLEPWDVVRAVDGQAVTSSAEIAEIVRRRPPGSTFLYTVARGRSAFTVPIPSRTFTVSDFAREPLPWLVSGLFSAAAGLFIFYARPGWTTFGFAAFGVAMGTALLRLDFLVGAVGARVLQAILPLIPAALVHLALVFPRRPAPLLRRPWLLVLPYGVSIALGIARARALFSASGVWVALDQASFLYCGIASAFVLGMFVYWARRAPDPADRERARVVLWGLVPASAATVLGIAIHVATDSRAAISLTPPLATGLWIGSLAYAAAKRNVFEFEIVVRHALTYAILWCVTVALYGAVLAASFAVLQRSGYPPQALLPLLAVVFAIPFVPGLFASLRRRVEARMFPLRVRLTEVVRELSEGLSPLMATADVAETVSRTFRERVGVSSAWVYLATEDGFSCPSPAAPALGTLAPEPTRRLEGGKPIPILPATARTAAVRDWMHRHGLTLLLPLIAGSRLRGLLALGEPPGGRIFNSEDVDTLSTLASRIAISLTNADAYDRVRELEDRLREENRALREELELHPGFPEIVGRSPKMQALFRTIEQVAPTETTVLLLGETGVGKELVAEAIHVRSGRRDGPFVNVSCAAIPAGLSESELFGHERGAFTDAEARRHGRFELAQRGTIFLDEVSELPLDVQAKCLRVIQEREFERVGGSQTLHADVRVVAASNRDLAAEVAAGRFREDLYFRLCVFPVTVPPLRDRSEDIPLLVDHFITRLGAERGRRFAGVSAESREELVRYPWPGNVRELKNVIERAMALSRGEWLEIPRLDAPRGETEPDRPQGGGLRPLSEVVRAAKIAAIDRALALGGTQVRAAEILGLQPPSLSRMLRDLGFRR